MTPGEFVEIVKNISYRPDWTLRVDWSMVHNGVQVVLDARVNDAYSPYGVKLSVMMAKWLSAEEVAYFTEERVLDWVRRFLFMEMEEHENREWFQYRGVRVFDPHKNDPKPEPPGEQYGRGTPPVFNDYTEQYE